MGFGVQRSDCHSRPDTLRHKLAKTLEKHTYPASYTPPLGLQLVLGVDPVQNVPGPGLGRLPLLSVTAPSLAPFANIPSSEDNLQLRRLLTAARPLLGSLP